LIVLIRSALRTLDVFVRGFLPPADKGKSLSAVAGIMLVAAAHFFQPSSLVTQDRSTAAGAAAAGTRFLVPQLAQTTTWLVEPFALVLT